MSLPIPLTVRIGDQHVTRKAESLSFRKEAIGGLRSISFKLRHPVDTPPEYLQPLTRVDVYDARSAEIVAQGRVADTGRTTAGDGQSWEVVAFGPAQAASDVTRPKVWVDRELDGWVPSIWAVNGNAEATTSNGPESGTPGLFAKHPNGATLYYSTGGGPWPAEQSRAEFIYGRIWHSGDKVARVSTTWDAGITDGTFALQIGSGSDGTIDTAVAMAFSDVAGGTLTANSFSGDNTAALRYVWAPATDPHSVTVGTDTVWAHFSGPVVEVVRHEADGTEITAGYVGYVYSTTVATDLLGDGFLPGFDAARSEVTAPGINPITQLAYPEGVNAAQVLDDLMAVDPDYRWYTEPDRTGDGYILRWEQWPTTVRYEATLEDGGSFPMSTQGIYNAVVVTWQDANGAPRTTTRTSTCDILDTQGLTRKTTIAMPTSAGTTAGAAESFGDNFLTEHNVPMNGGTLTVARPIRDLRLGRMVEPFEIEAGELVRVRGVESYADALNADSNDGESVFRIFAVDYTSDDNRASLSLDADPKTTSAALAKLLTQRTR